MGLLKNLALGPRAGSHGALARRAVEHMRGLSRVSFATRAEMNRYLLRGDAGRYASCLRCSLADSRRTVVFGRGSVEPDVVLVQGAPGEGEDESGKALDGREGALLAGVARSVGLDLSRVFATGTVCCRTPRDREPDKGERGACSGRLWSTLEVLAPTVLVLLGPSAALAVGVRDREGLASLPEARWPLLGRARFNLRAVLLAPSPREVLLAAPDKRGPLVRALASTLGAAAAVVARAGPREGAE